MIRRFRDLYALPAALVIGAAVGVSVVRERWRRRRAGERWVAAATVSMADASWAEPLSVEGFVERRMRNRERKVRGHQWVVLAHDQEWVLLGYPTALADTLELQDLFKVDRRALDTRFPCWAWLDGVRARQLALGLARTHGLEIAGLTQGVHLDPVVLWAASGEARAELPLGVQPPEEDV